MDERFNKILFNKASDKSYDDDGEYVGHDIGSDDTDSDDESNDLGKDDDEDGDKNPITAAYVVYLQTVMRTIILNSNITEVPSNFDKSVVKAVSVYRNVSKGLLKVRFIYVIWVKYYTNWYLRT